MRGICAKCRGTFDGQMLCPQCGLQLIEETEGSSISFASVPIEDTPDGPSLPRRLALGAVTLFGAFHGLQHLATVVSLTSGGTEFARPEVPVVCLAIAALGAAIIAGTANRRAEATGLLLALCAGAAFVGADEIRHAPVAETWLTGIPVFLGLIGIVGGLVGRIAVPPAPRLPRFAQLGSRITPTIVGEPPARIAWGRILAGAAVVVAGTMNADAIQQA